jgi:hypothetical protein
MKMIKNLFILLISHGRSGSSAVRGYLNLSPDINMAFEENLMILQDTNKKVWASPDQFSFDHDLLKRSLPSEFNGNKIILGPHFISAERIVEAVNRKVCIVNDNFDYLKILFITRNKDDLIQSIADRKGGSGYLDWAKENWEINEREIKKLKEYFPDHFSFDFYGFLQNFEIRESIFEFLDLSYSSDWNKHKVDTMAYGTHYLSTDVLQHYTEKLSYSKPELEESGDFKVAEKVVKKKAKASKPRKTKPLKATKKKAVSTKKKKEA